MSQASRRAAAVSDTFPLAAVALGARELDASRLRAHDWAVAVELAGWHGLQPAMHAALERRGLLDQLPAAPRHALHIARVVAELRAESRRRQLADVLGTLRAIGVRVIALKGAHLAERLYDAPSLRPMTDLDLLLPDPEIPRACAALRAAGYLPDGAPSPARHAPALRRAGALPVELHRIIEPCAAPFTLPLDAVWSRAVPTRVADACVLALAPEDLLLHLATHMTHSHVLGASLTSVYDVYRWCVVHGADADWDAVVRRGHAAGVHGLAYAALSLARQLFGADVPAAPLAALRASDADDVIVAHALGLLAAPPFVIVGAKAVTDPRDDWAARARRIARALLVSPAREALGPRLAARVGDRDAGAATGDGYAARWGALLRLLAAPTRGWATLRQVARVRTIRRWSAAGSNGR